MNSLFPGILVRYSDIANPDIKTNVSIQSSDLSLGLDGPEAKNWQGLKVKPTGKLNPIQDELHINLWELHNRQFLDIGVKFRYSKKIKTIEIDLPFVALQDQVQDLGHKLDNESIIGAIFNDVVKYTGSNETPVAHIEINGKKVTLLKLNENHINVRSTRSKTTTVALNVYKFHLNAGEIAYFRLRIESIPIGMYLSKFSQKDKNILSSAMETSIVDFRVNVRRGVPKEILTRDILHKESDNYRLIFPKFKKIHVFFITEREKEISFEGENFVACRSLQDEAIWNDYINIGTQNQNDGKNVSALLGYQWTVKSKDGVKGINALARFSTVISGSIRLMQFLLMAIILGALGNGAWDLTKLIYSSNDLLFFSIVNSPINNLFNDTEIAKNIIGPAIYLVLFFLLAYCIESIHDFSKKIIRFLKRILKKIIFFFNNGRIKDKM